MCHHDYIVSCRHRKVIVFPVLVEHKRAFLRKPQPLCVGLHPAEKLCIETIIKSGDMQPEILSCILLDSLKIEINSQEAEPAKSKTECNDLEWMSGHQHAPSERRTYSVKIVRSTFYQAL
jgi:hypothetical protein